MPRPTGRYRGLAFEILEDRITPTITYTGFDAGFTVGSDPHALASGDLTGNGITDLLVGDPADDVEVWLGDGHGNFTPDGTVHPGIDVTMLQLVDLTGNGKLDMVGGDNSNHVLFVAMGNGDGTFQTPITWTAIDGDQSMAIADMNGDGRPDVVLGIPDGVAVFLNDGTGNIFDNGTYYFFAHNFDSIGGLTVGDFNGDGHPDVAVTDYEGKGVYIYLNNGDGTLATPTRYNNPIAADSGGIVTGDFNNDGKLDLVVGYDGTTDVGLLLGNGDGTFQAPSMIDTSIAAGPLVAADFDQDGNLDLAMSASDAAVILPGNGVGGFGAPISLGGVPYSTDLLAADFNGDGLPDLAVVGDTSPGAFGIALNTSPDAEISSFNVSAPATVNAGESFVVTLTAQNALGATLAGYTGTVDFSTSDQQAGFPASVQFAPSDRGVKSLTVRVSNAGTLSVDVQDSIVASATGTTNVTVNPSLVNGDNSTVSFENATDLSGTTDQVMIVLEDNSGNPVTGLTTGDFNFSLSGGTSTGTFGTVTETPGTYTANFTGFTAGTPSTLTLEVDDTEISNQPAVTVIPGDLDAKQTTVQFAFSTVTSGMADMITIEARDAAGNAIDGLTNSDFDLSLSEGTSTGSFGIMTATSNPGTYTTSFTGNLAGSPSSLVLTIDDLLIENEPTIQVEPGAVDAGKSSVSVNNSNDVTGTTDTVTIVVEDAVGNPISNLGSNLFEFDFTGGTSTGSVGAVTESSTPGTYTAEFTGNTVGSAGSLILRVDSVQILSEPSIQVNPGPVNSSSTTVSFTSSSDQSGTADVVTIAVKDANGNAIGGLSNSDFNLSLSGGSSTGSLDTVTETSTPGTYTANFTGFTAGTPTTLTLKVDGVMIPSQPQVTVLPGVADAVKSTVSLATSTVASGKTDVVTYVVKDAAGNAITGLINLDFAYNFTGGSSSGSVGNLTETSKPGTYHGVLTGITAGTASSLLTFIDGVQLASEPTIQVNPGILNGAISTVSFATPTVASGTTDILTITLRDANGNAISGIKNSSFVFLALGGTSTGTLGPVTATATPGTYSAVFTGILAGTPKGLGLKVNGIPIASHPTVQVKSGAVSRSKTVIHLASPSVVSGKIDLIVIVVKDAAGNAISGLTNGDFALNLSGGESAGTFGTVAETIVPGHYTVAFTGTSAGTASILTVAIDNILIGMEPKLAVRAGSVSGSLSSASFTTPTVESGTTDMVTFTVKDAAGNPISGLPSSAFAFNLAGGTSSGKLSSVIPTTTPGNYVATFIGVLAGTSTTLEVKIGGVQLVTQPSVQVTPGSVNAAKSIASFATPSVKTGNTDTLTITVKDANGNAITGLGDSDFFLGLFGGTSSGSFGTVTETQTPGTYTVVFTGEFAGTATTLSIRVDGVLLVTKPKVIVTT